MPLEIAPRSRGAGGSVLQAKRFVAEAPVKGKDFVARRRADFEHRSFRIRVNELRQHSTPEPVRPAEKPPPKAYFGGTVRSNFRSFSRRRGAVD